jgi:hypothetical protein
MFGWENSKPKRIVERHDLELNRLPKRFFVVGNVLQLGVYDAVAHFNMGSRASVDILQQDGLVHGYYFEEGVCKADKKHVKKADHRAKPDVKKRRKVVRGQKKYLSY